jgi:cation transport regulator
MPYDNLRDLPDSVQNVLPTHAQDIYMKAFNSAWDEYEKPSSRRTNEGREETAHKVAWNAVKQSYEKSEDGKWLKKSE